MNHSSPTTVTHEGRPTVGFPQNTNIPGNQGKETQTMKYGDYGCEHCRPESENRDASLARVDGSERRLTYWVGDIEDQFKQECRTCSATWTCARQYGRSKMGWTTMEPWEVGPFPGITMVPMSEKGDELASSLEEA